MHENVMQNDTKLNNNQ